MKHLVEALSKSMIKKLVRRPLNNTYYIVIPWDSNIRECINKTDAIFVDNKTYDSGYSSFFIATKEQSQELKDITGEVHDLIYAIVGDKQYHTIEEIIEGYFNDDLSISSRQPTLIDVTDKFN